MIGPGTNKWYPKLATDYSTIITDLQASSVAINAKDPNNLLGKVAYNRATDTTKYTWELISGDVLVQWIAWLNLYYASYKAEVTTYDAERTLWEAFLKYEAPAPGLFGPTADPDAPKAMSKPRAPTQPATLATDVSGLAKIGAVAAKVVYRGAGGYGKPSAQKLTLVAEKTVRPFGTLAGQGVAVAPPALDAKASTYSIRKTTNYKDYTAGTTIDTCDNAYLMITSVVVTTALAAAKDFQITVTATKWG